MKYKGAKKNIEVILVGGMRSEKTITGNALLGKDESKNDRQSYSMYRMNQQRQTKSKCYFHQESTKQILRKESASRCGRQITIVHTADTMNEVHLHAELSRQNTGVKCRQKKKKKKVVIFYVVYGKFTQDDDDMLDKLLSGLDKKTRKKLFVVLTDYVEDAEISPITFRKKLPIIQVNSSLTAKENEDQIKKIIKEILTEKALEKKKSGVIAIRLIHSTGILLLWALSVLDVLEAKATHVRRNADIVKWNRMTKPILFGENVNLECIIEAKHTDEIMTWTKIPHGETIALNEIPSNIKKYDSKVVHFKSQMVYKLTIKNFNMADVNCLYRCNFGFVSVGDKLSLNEKDFISKPEQEDVDFKFNISDSELTGHIQIKNGYPAPLCKGHFEGQHISEIVTSNTNDSVLFQSDIVIKHRTIFCKGTIIIICSYGNHNINITDEVNMCSNKTEVLPSSNQTVYVISIVTSLGILFLIIACIAIIKIKQHVTRQYLLIKKLNTNTVEMAVVEDVEDFIN